MTRFRKSPRLRGFDYSRDAVYFITVSVQKGLHLFGQIQDHDMIPNDAGKMINCWYLEIQNKFPDWQCGKSMVMPDHFHAIIGKRYSLSVLNKHGGGDKFVDRRGGPVCAVHGHRAWCPPKSFTALDQNLSPTENGLKNNAQTSGQKRFNASLSVVMQWFKTMTTNEYIRGVKHFEWEPFHGKLWQRSFHDRVIRKESDYHLVSKYIVTNPTKWQSNDFWD